MTHVFPSQPWAAAYGAAINANGAYQEAARAWTHGPVAIVCRADPAIGLGEDVGIWLDLHEGACRDARVVPAHEAAGAAFCIIGTYPNWKDVLQGRLDPIAGMMLGRLELKGSLGIVVRFVQAAQEMVASADHVPTTFLDEAGRGVGPSRGDEE